MPKLDKLSVMKYSELHGIVEQVIKFFKDSRHPLRKYARLIVNEIVTTEGIDPKKDEDFDLPPKLALRGHKLRAMLEADKEWNLNVQNADRK